MDKTNFHTAAATAGIVCVVSGFVNHSPVEIGIGASLILTPVLDEVMTLDNALHAVFLPLEAYDALRYKLIELRR